MMAVCTSSVRLLEEEEEEEEEEEDEEAGGGGGGGGGGRGPFVNTGAGKGWVEVWERVDGGSGRGNRNLF